MKIPSSMPRLKGFRFSREITLLHGSPDIGTERGSQPKNGLLMP